MRYPFWNTVAFFNQPTPFRILLESVQPVVKILVAVTTVCLRVHVIGDDYDGGSILHRVVHVSARDWTTNTTKASE